MLVKVHSAALLGIEAYVVEVEVDISLGLPGHVTVGLPDAAVRESKERIRAALKNCGFEFPSRKLTINLAPADRRKEGSSFDLPISLGLLCYLQIIPGECLRDYLFLGELADAAVQLLGAGGRAARRVDRDDDAGDVARLADAAEDEDSVSETGGVKLVVDPVSLDLVQGCVVDYVESLGGAAFKVTNPNATAGCGCGTSFSV